MPRRKRPVPEPLETYHYTDLIVEVYPDGQLPTGRGLPGRYKKMHTFDLALELLWEAKQNARRGFEKQFFVDIRVSAAALERALTKRHGRRHSLQVQQRICRAALRLYGLTGDDAVRLPYVFDGQRKKP